MQLLSREQWPCICHPPLPPPLAWVYGWPPTLFIILTEIEYDLFFLPETEFLCLALAVLELTDIYLPLPASPGCWD